MKYAALGLFMLVAACEQEATNPDAILSGGDSGGTPSELTVWSSGAGTTGVPTFGKNCRLAADHITSSASNGLNDDSIQVMAPTSDATVVLVVSSGEGQVLNAQVEMARGLKDKSYRSATGQATWGFPPRSGTVIDGTLCFPERLTDGTATQAEFSLVMDDGTGAYHSVSGTLNLPGSAVKLTSGVDINGMVDIDLK